MLNHRFIVLHCFTIYSELEAAVSKLKLEVTAFHQSLDNSISNLDVLTKQLRDLLIASSQVEEVEDNFILNQPITYENVEGALEACQVSRRAC